MTGQPHISVGQVLVLREEFDCVAHEPNASFGATLRARLLVRLLDEVLDWRERAARREPANGST
jgi:hypothetical protein